MLASIGHKGHEGYTKDTKNTPHKAALRVQDKRNPFLPGLSKTALRNLWSEALSSENFQLTTNAEASLRSNNPPKLIVAFFAVAERNKF